MAQHAAIQPACLTYRAYSSGMNLLNVSFVHFILFYSFEYLITISKQVKTMNSSFVLYLFEVVRMRGGSSQCGQGGGDELLYADVRTIIVVKCNDTACCGQRRSSDNDFFPWKISANARSTLQQL